MPSISVIVPIYKVEKYLDRCVKSILNQTFSDFELILVDDGSPDKCPQMCDEYQKQDSRIKVIHKENGGIAETRNVGLDAVITPFFIYIDSDDFIEPTMLETLINLQRENDYDIACCGISDCYENGVHYSTSERTVFHCTGCKALEYTLEGRLLGGSLCNKLIRTSIVANHRFLVGKTYEDAYFMPELFGNAKSVIISTEPLYNYWHRAGSITQCRFSKSSLDVIGAYEYTYQYVRKNCPELTKLSQFRVCWAYFVVLDRMMRTPYYSSLPEFRQTVAYLRQHTSFICSCEYFQKTRRLSAIVLKFSVFGYKVLSSANDRKSEVFGHEKGLRG